MARPRRRPEEVDAAVLAALKAAGRPVGAYQVMAALAPVGIRTPPTVYRALERLVRGGRAHRVESLNAFVACATEAGPAAASPHPEDGRVVFLLCRGCGRAVELTDPELLDDLERAAAAAGFSVERISAELGGLCSACAAS